jgi:transketolase
LVGAGVTLHTCLDAAEQLATKGISARVIDLYSVKPVDKATLLAAVKQTGGRLVVIEDHYPEGGLCGAITEALAPEGVALNVRHLCVRKVPGSGKTSDLFVDEGIDSASLVRAATALIEENK